MVEDSYFVYDGQYQAKPLTKNEENVDLWFIDFSVSVPSRLAVQQRACQLVLQTFELNSTVLTIVLIKKDRNELKSFGFTFDLDAVQKSFDPSEAVDVAGAYIDNLCRPAWQESHVVDGVCWYKLPTGA